MNLNELLKNPLNEDQILKLVNYKSKILTYPELVNYKNIDNVLYPHDSAIILYETKKHYGHWCCIIKRKNNIEFFDPYGIFPDEQLYFVNPNFRIINNMRKGYLSYLLNKSKYKLEYNNYKLQCPNPEIATCGRWVGYRILNKNINIDKFAKIFLDNKYFEPDELICLKTFYIQ